MVLDTRPLRSADAEPIGVDRSEEAGQTRVFTDTAVDKLPLQLWLQGRGYRIVEGSADGEMVRLECHLELEP